MGVWSEEFEETKSGEAKSEETEKMSMTVNIQNEEQSKIELTGIELTILMPCLNEEQTVGSCVTIACNYLKDRKLSGEVLVCDNGSTDLSVKRAEEAGAQVISCNRTGYGNTLRYGIEHSHGTYIIMGDCDMSYDFAALDEMYQALTAGNDMVIGNRFVYPTERGAMPFSHKYLGVPVLSWLGRIRYKSTVKDFHCGLRGVKRDSFLALSCKAEGMEFATEMIGLATKAGQSVAQVPVVLYRDQRNGKSHLHSIRDGFRHLKVLCGK